MFHILYLLGYCVNAQNLVPNPSFEQATGCPQGPGQISLLNGGWTSIYSSDYFSACATGSFGYQVDIPVNKNGYQLPKEGNNYAGFLLYSDAGATNDYREWMAVKLFDTLQPGNSYCVSYHVSLADSSHYAIANVQALFSDTLITHLIDYNPSAQFYYYPASVNNPAGGVINDTGAWVRIEGIYSPSSKKPWLMLGNFDNYSQIDTLVLPYNSSVFYSYYYLDQISVTQIKPVAVAKDTILANCDTVILGINYDDNARYEWWPNVYISDSTAANPIAIPQSTSTYYVRKTQCGIVSVDSVKITVLGCNIGMRENFERAIQLFPNPNRGEFTINVKSKVKDLVVELYNVYGQLLQSKAFDLSSSGEVKINDLDDGIYLVKLIVDGSYHKTHRLLVIK